MPMKPAAAEASDLLMKLDQAARFIRQRSQLHPAAGIVLGTGLGALAGKVKADAVIPYKEIPNFPVSTVESHAGKLILGTLAGKPVAVLQGRFHLYEGYSAAEVAFPVRVLGHLGSSCLVVTNAAGGLNPVYAKGDMVLIEDHINFMGSGPLTGANDERVGPRFPDMCRPYSSRLAGVAMDAARELQLRLHRGVYIGVLGPNLETRAEYRMMRAWGADLVGMSSIPEVIAAVHMGIETLALSVVTDVCDPDHLEPVNIKEIIRVANEAGPRLDQLIEAVLRKL